MASSQRVSRLVLGSLLLLGASLFFFTTRPASLLFRRQTSGSWEQGRRVPPAGNLRAPVSDVVKLQEVQERPSPILPNTVAEILPELTARVGNWKEFRPEKITVAPYPDLPVEFEMTSIREEHGRTVWTGRNAALEGAFLVTAATEDDWHATLVVPIAGVFDMHISGSTVTKLDKDVSSGLCGAGPGTTLQTPAALVSAPETVTAVAAAAESSATAVDVLFFYDADVLASLAGNTSTLETYIIAYVAASNAALENSQVTNFRWRYLGAYQVPAYTATTDLGKDLETITGYTPSTGTSYVPAPNAVSTFAQQKAALHGADQIVLYVGSNPTRNYAGIAWVSPGANLAFHSAAAVWPSNPGGSGAFLTVAHEMAHAFGCYHDRTTESAPDGDGKFHYGFRYTRFGRDTGTIMAYASQAVPYFSNPSATFEGVALGVAEGQPKAANNARVLRESAQAMIDSRPAVEFPAITTQPQSVTVTTGQTLSLSVAATGSNLIYQWKFNGTDISGATGSTFAKTAASADAGAYTVSISNVVGQVTSNSATVTVTAAPSGGGTTSPSAPSTGGGGGGGGGGGSSDGWVASAVGLFVIARCVRRKTAR